MDKLIGKRFLVLKADAENMTVQFDDGTIQNLPVYAMPDEELPKPGEVYEVSNQVTVH